MAKMDPNWFAVPFECQSVSERMEDVAEAANIPRVAILNPSASLDEC